MPIAFACPHCGHGLRLPEHYAGRRGKCPKCQNVLPIPSLDSPVLAPLAAGSRGDAASEATPRHAGSAVAETIDRPRTTAGPTLPSQARTPTAPSQSAASPQEIHRQVMSGFRREFSPGRTSLAYRLGVLLTAAFMVLLPLIYVGLIVLVALAVFWHATNNVWIMQSVRGRAVIVAVLLYAAPIVSGGILVLFMVKPLFNWSTADRRSRTINRGSDPLLFAFVDHICEVVRSPKPARIEIDCEINASASFDGVWGMFANRLVLTIGMPLAATMSLQQLAGVIAHEFGHFSQGTGMRLTYVIRTINHWFMRVVYERDSWDDWLVQTAAESDLRLGWVLYLAMLFVWVTRKILLGLMLLGHLVAGFMLRQMEFDADTYEARLVGSQTFESTAHRLHQLGIAWHGARQDLGSFHREGRLADNLPKLIMANVRQLPEEVVAFVDKAIAAGTTGWFDSHPCDRERIAAARAFNAQGAFQSDLPATMLFRDFDAASKNVTWDFYRAIFSSQLRPQDLHPIDDLLAQQDREIAYHETLKRYFGGRFGWLRPLSLPTNRIQTIQNADAARQRLADLRSTMESEGPGYALAYERYDELDTQRLTALQLAPLLACECRVAPRDDMPRYREGGDAVRHAEQLRTQMARLANDLAAYEHTLGERLYLGLCFAFHERVSLRLENADALQRQTEALLPLVTQISSLLESLNQLRNHAAVLSSLFAHLEGNEENQPFIREIRDYSQRLYTQVRDLWGMFRHAEYPFDHAKGKLTIASYLLASLPPSDEIGLVYDAAENLLGNLLSLYQRSLARLCETAEAVESALGFEPLRGKVE
jgi:Zn-dependent protease with chaperone function